MSGFYKRSVPIDEFQRLQFFPAWKNSVTHHYFIPTSMSDCHSVAICHQETKHDWKRDENYISISQINYSNSCL